MEEKKSNVGIVILITGIVLLIIIGVWYYLNIINTEDTGKTPQNVVIENEIQQVTEEKFTLTESEFPKVDGATAMLPMVGEMTKEVLGYTDNQAQEYLDENTQGKTAKVYASLINKQKDLIFVSEPSDDILRQAQDANVEFEMVGIGYDGFVFLINKENPVESLTLDQIRKIYSGEITNWKEVGGEDAEIYAYQREENSGSQNLMEKMVMQDTKMARPKASDLRIESMSGLIDAVAKDQNSKYSIGYSIYLYAKEQYVKDSIKFLNINGVVANDENISNKTYPLTKVVYAVMRKDEPQNSAARKLVEWLLTEEGQKVVVAGGYVGL